MSLFMMKHASYLGSVLTVKACPNYLIWLMLDLDLIRYINAYLSFHHSSRAFKKKTLKKMKYSYSTDVLITMRLQFCLKRIYNIAVEGNYNFLSTEIKLMSYCFSLHVFCC